MNTLQPIRRRRVRHPLERAGYGAIAVGLLTATLVRWLLEKYGPEHEEFPYGTMLIITSHPWAERASMVGLVLVLVGVIAIIVTKALGLERSTNESSAPTTAG